MSRRPGFTLIELLIVLLILSLGASLVGPVTLRQVEKTRALAEREQLAIALQQARFTAFTQAAAVQIAANGTELIVQYPQQSLRFEFEYLSFPRQELVVNSHGFWQLPEIVWQEGSDVFRRQLNQVAVQ
jgi:prepilin-type N-terminal cleavage/methylation domain-containing protein